MIDPNYIRQNSEYVKKIIVSGRSNPEKADIDRWLELDNQRSDFIQKRDEKREMRNELSSGLKGKPDQAIIQQVKDLKAEIEAIEKDLGSVECEWQEILDWVPNIPVSEVAMPFGSGEPENRIDSAWVPGLGYVYVEEEHDATYTVDTFPTDLMPERSSHWDADLLEPKHHVEVGEALGMFDIAQGAKVSGTRFKYLTGDGALLEHALQRYMVDKLIEEGFEPVSPPLLVKGRSLYGTSHFPEGEDQVYAIEMDQRKFEEGSDKLYLVGSSEPTNFSLFMDKTLDSESLPRKIFAYTPCFRSEAGSWGKDTRGIKRVHQFGKVEMNIVSHPNQSSEMFTYLLSLNEWLWQSLEIPYRITRKCTGDAGYHASAEQIDPEGWLPAQKEFIELGTDTNTTDFQARRMNIKFKGKDGEKGFVHTLNDTGLPIERTIIAIIDNYQQSDGSVVVPEVLRPYMGKDVITK